ncbi:MAG TPA: APC family permease [Trebonia sp.]|nr:APC family permease [Trebonia sp.]
MTDRPATAVPGPRKVPPSPAHLEPDAIGALQDTVLGIANTGPAVSVGLSLAALAAAAAYASGPTLILCGIPMVIIANAYRRLNHWNANCGASFEWVGRTISPYLGFLTGWLVIAANLVGNVAAVVVLAPSVLAIFGANATSTWPNIAIATVAMLVIIAVVVAGIRPTARVQVALAAVEYVILIGFAIAGFVAVLGHHGGTYPVTRSWFSLGGIGGKGNLAAGLLIAVFMYTGWDATVYVNEEVRRRHVNPGRAAIFAVAFVGIFYAVVTTGLQGVVTPARLQANASSALVYVAQVLAGSGWAKVMALALALSVIGGTGAGLVCMARMAYGMASHRTLPAVFGRVNPRFSTPAIATIVSGVILIAATWAYLLSASLANVFSDVIDTTGLLFGAFYVLTALAAIAYYRRRIVSNLWDTLLVGILPLAAAGFLCWIIVRSLQTAPAPELWSLAGIIAAGVILMFAARFILRSPFFRIRLEAASRS